MTAANLGELLNRAREVQERLARVQRELAGRTVEGSAGGGLVTVVASGELRIRSVRIEPQLLEGGDREMLGDLLAAAVNAALANAQRMIQEEMQRAAGGLSLGAGPPGGSDPGPDPGR